MREPLPLSLDNKYHMFCSLIIIQSRVCKISVRCILQKFPMTIGILAKLSLAKASAYSDKYLLSHG